MTSSNPYLDKIRRLTWALGISGVLNVAVVSLLIYYITRERVPIPYFEHKPADQEEQLAPLADHRTSSEVILAFKDLTFPQLISRLNQTHLIENGFTERDLALAALISFHHFDVQRALAGLPQPQQQRCFVCAQSDGGKPIQWSAFPGLSDEQFDAIIHFLKTERWPITSRGLYLLLQTNESKDDPSITEAFYLTSEFLSVEMLFNRATPSIGKDTLLKVIKEGNWKLLKDYVHQQRISNDLSEARRQKFLLDYIKQGSQSAAYILLKTDGEFATKKLDDKDVIAILNLLPNKTVESEKFALELMTSPRTNEVWKRSSARLYQYAGEEIPIVWNYQNDLKRFAPHRLVAQTLDKAINRTSAATPSSPVVAPPKKLPSTPVAVQPKKTQPIPSVQPKKQVVAATPPPPPTPKPVPKEMTYIIQEGDSLWKISKRFGVSVDQMKAYNQMKSDALKPGTILKIPKVTKS